MSDVGSAVEIKSNKVYMTNFLLLISGRFVSDLGSAVFKFALSLYVLDLTGSAAAFSMILGFSILPNVIMNILIGAYVDKSNKKVILVVSDILCGIVVLTFMMLFKVYSTSILLFIIYVIILSIIQSFFSLALSASIPNIVKEENTAKANSASQSISAIINIVGPIIGAIAYKSIGLEKLFIIDGVTFIVAGICEIFLRYKSKASQGEGEQSSRYIDQVKVVFSYLNSDKPIQIIIYFVVAINFFFTPLMLLVLPFITYTDVKVSAMQLSFIQGSWAVGSIVGAIFVSSLKSTRPILVRVFNLLLVQAGFLVLWIFPKFPLFGGSSKWVITIVFVILLVITGIYNTLLNIPLITCIQLRIPENMRARVFGVINTATLISTPLGMWIYGALLGKINWMYIIIVSAIFIGALALIAGRNTLLKKFLAEA